MWRPEESVPVFLSVGPQLPVQAYFDEAVLRLEESLLFQQGPQYAGHALMVPELHDHCVLPHRDNGVALVHSTEGLRLVSNVCRHRQATILQGQGNAQRLSCPLHRWTYDTQGALLIAPRFRSTPCVALETFPLNAWHGLQFTGTAVAPLLADVPRSHAELLDFEHLQFGHMEVHDCNYNWKAFVEFYLEDYHVAPFHPGLGRFVSCDELTWFFGEHWSMQTVGFHRGLTQPGDSEVYRAWHAAVLQYYGEQLPAVGAMWFMLYPNVMVEWYPMVTVVSTVYPRGTERSVNVVEYYHPRALCETPQGRAMAQLAAQAYLETALEDNDIGERMHEGRRALWRRGASEVGPYHEQLEAGMAHFHHHVQRRLRGFAPF